MYKLAAYEVEESKRYAGLDVSLTRGLRDNPDLYERSKQARGFDFILSDHSNANSRADSSAVHIYRSVKRPDERLAIALAKTIAETMGAPYKILTRKDSKGGDYYGMLRIPENMGVKMPLLLEHGYHTNSKQCEWLMSDANLKLLAAKKMKVIADFYGLKLKTPPVVFYNRGDSGEGVKALQNDLVALGYSLAVDGSFGPGTETIVKKFQADNKLTVDGYAGPQTLKLIADLIEEKEKAPQLTFAPEGYIYRIQVGANSVREYGEETLKQLREDGYTKAFMKLEKL